MSSSNGDRLADMVRRRAAGESLISIGVRYGVSRERVRQILVKAKGPSFADARQARLVVAEAKRVEDAKVLRAWLLEHPGSTGAQVERALGMDRGVPRQLLGEDAGRLLSTPQTRNVVFSREEVLAGIRVVAAEVGEPLTAVGYEKARGRHELISMARICQLFGGSWAAACAAAGVVPGEASRDNYTRNWTEEDLLRWVAQYLTSPGATGTYAGMTSWLQGQFGAPSSQTIRNTLGRWQVAKCAALTLLASLAQSA